jgi:hypothetical protein
MCDTSTCLWCGNSVTSFDTCTFPLVPVRGIWSALGRDHRWHKLLQTEPRGHGCAREGGAPPAPLSSDRQNLPEAGAGRLRNLEDKLETSHVDWTRPSSTLTSQPITQHSDLSDSATFSATLTRTVRSVESHCSQRQPLAQREADKRSLRRAMCRSRRELHVRGTADSHSPPFTPPRSAARRSWPGVRSTPLPNCASDVVQYDHPPSHTLHHTKVRHKECISPHIAVDRHVSSREGEKPTRRRLLPPWGTREVLNLKVSYSGHGKMPGRKASNLASARGYVWRVKFSAHQTSLHRTCGPGRSRDDTHARAPLSPLAPGAPGPAQVLAVPLRQLPALNRMSPAVRPA